MTNEEIRELAAVYALGGLDGDDRARFEVLLRAGDLDATAAFREFETTVVDLAGTSPAAPAPSVKRALMERIASPGSTVPSPVVTAARRRRALWPAVWTAALAAGVAAIVVALSISSSYETRLDTLGREAAQLRGELERQRQIIALVRDPATQIVSLAGLATAPAAKARMLWNAPAGGLLLAAGLPPAPAGQTYQLWAIVGTNPPVSAGVFGVDEQGTGSLRVPPRPDVGQVDVFAVTLEPAGGVAAPSGPMYLAGKS
jgi:anti-sigma-K factor RskA